MATIPLTAWEQGGMVVLFVVFVIALLYWFSRQQKQWQDFIKDMNATWQGYLAAQKKEDNGKISELTKAIKDLTDYVANLSKTVEVHIADEDAMLDAMLTEREKEQVQQQRGRKGKMQ